MSKKCEYQSVKFRVVPCVVSFFGLMLVGKLMKRLPLLALAWQASTSIYHMMLHLQSSFLETLVISVVNLNQSYFQHNMTNRGRLH